MALCEFSFFPSTIRIRNECRSYFFIWFKTLHSNNMYFLFITISKCISWKNIQYFLTFAWLINNLWTKLFVKFEMRSLPFSAFDTANQYARYSASESKRNLNFKHLPTACTFSIASMSNLYWASPYPYKFPMRITFVLFAACT